PTVRRAALRRNSIAPIPPIAPLPPRNRQEGRPLRTVERTTGGGWMGVLADRVAVMTGATSGGVGGGAGRRASFVPTDVPSATNYTRSSTARFHCGLRGKRTPMLPHEST